MFLNVCLRLYVCVHVSVWTLVASHRTISTSQVCVCECICMYVYTYIYIYIYIYILCSKSRSFSSTNWASYVCYIYVYIICVYAHVHAHNLAASHSLSVLRMCVYVCVYAENGASLAASRPLTGLFMQFKLLYSDKTEVKARTLRLLR